MRVTQSLNTPRLRNLYFAYLNIDFMLLQADHREAGNSDNDARDYSQSPWSDHATGYIIEVMMRATVLAKGTVMMKETVMAKGTVVVKALKGTVMAKATVTAKGTVRVNTAVIAKPMKPTATMESRRNQFSGCTPQLGPANQP